MHIEFSSRIRVFAGDNLLYNTHAQDAARLLRDGLAQRRGEGRKVRALSLTTIGVDCAKRKRAFGNPQKYIFTEALGEPVTSHCQALKLHIANPKNWPIYRAALVDCLPAGSQAEIRELFAPRQKRRAA